MATILLGTNRFTGCSHLISLGGKSLLGVTANPPRLTLRTPRDKPDVIHVEIEDNQLKQCDPSFKTDLSIGEDARSVWVVWKDIQVATVLASAPDTIHVRIDMRPLGLNVFDDSQGLHLGKNTLARNTFENCETAIGLT